MKDRIKISVITVCFNAEHVIEETIKSVLKQTYQNMEYLIVDGGSDDGTLDLIRKYETDAAVRFISEPDDGIYDAMNKGSMLAEGDYIQFLNAGDVFADEFVIERIVAGLEKTNADVLYGNIIYRYPDGSTNIRVYGQFCSSLFYYLLGDCINHQSVFARRECLLRHRFDLSYQVCADREWMIRLKKDGYRFEALDVIVCEYSLDENSASIRNGDIYFEEAARCVREHLKMGYWLYLLIDRIRHGKLSSQLLHGLYKIVFIRRKR